MSSIKDLIKQNTHAHLGAKMSSPAAFQIYVVQLGLQVAGLFLEQGSRIAGALEVLAGKAAPGPTEAEIKARRKAAREAELAELERKRAELEKQDEEDGED